MGYHAAVAHCPPKTGSSGLALLCRLFRNRCYASAHLGGGDGLIDRASLQRSVGSEEHGQDDDGGHVLPTIGGDVHASRGVERGVKHAHCEDAAVSLEHEHPGQVAEGGQRRQQQCPVEESVFPPARVYPMAKSTGDGSGVAEWQAAPVPAAHLASTVSGVMASVSAAGSTR